VSGYPLRMAEMLSVIAPESYIARVSVNDLAHIVKTKKAIRKAFKVQMDGRGFGMVEILAACPTNWRMDPVRSMEKIKSDMMSYYPLGEFSAHRKELPS
jgi:2-oxoglutarate/2-oxoacid ferredoxin oxidoreductase subunit beta